MISSVRGTHNKLGERKVRLGQDSLPNSHFHSGNERKVGTLFYPHPKLCLPWLLGQRSNNFPVLHAILLKKSPSTH